MLCEQLTNKLSRIVPDADHQFKLMNSFSKRYGWGFTEADFYLARKRYEKLSEVYTNVLLLPQTGTQSQSVHHLTQAIFQASFVTTLKYIEKHFAPGHQIEFLERSFMHRLDCVPITFDICSSKFLISDRSSRLRESSDLASLTLTLYRPQWLEALQTIGLCGYALIGEHNMYINSNGLNSFLYLNWNEKNHSPSLNYSDFASPSDFAIMKDNRL